MIPKLNVYLFIPKLQGGEKTDVLLRFYPCACYPRVVGRDQSDFSNTSDLSKVFA